MVDSCHAALLGLGRLVELSDRWRPRYDGPVEPETPAKRLDSLDARLDALPGGARSLAPGRLRATPLGLLIDALARGDARRWDVLATALARVVEAQLEHFPENLFWDSDSIATSLAREPDAAALEERVQLIESLMRIYGIRGPVRFQYLHDFTYGFDWALWVRRRPEERAHVAPFGMAFLRYSAKRGHEMLALVASGDDSRYPPIPEHQRRNVFKYSREPEDELRLMRVLALEGAIPVKAWTLEVDCDYQRDFQSLREDVARTLGLSR